MAPSPASRLTIREGSPSWRSANGEVPSIFRASSAADDGVIPDCYEIRRCPAFDEGDDGEITDDDEEDELCYSDNDDDSTGAMAEF